MYKLYISKGSSALAAHILLEDIGAAYQTDERPIPAGAHQSEDYLAINPKGRLPALQTPEGILTENPAILWYLGETHAEAGLIPDETMARARLQELNAYICATIHIAFAHKARGTRWSDDPSVIDGMKVKVGENLAQAAGVIEAHYLRGPFVLGDTYSISDPYLFLVPRWLKACDITVGDYPKLAAHHDAMLARPATQAALAQHKA